MSKSKAVQWPVLITNSVSKSRPTISQSVTWKRVPRYCNSNINKKTLISGICKDEQQSSWLLSTGLQSGSSRVLWSPPSSSTSTRHRSRRSPLDSISCICSFGHLSPLLSRFLWLRRAAAPGSSWSSTHPVRLFHSSRVSNAQNTGDPVRPRTPRVRKNSPNTRKATASQHQDVTLNSPGPEKTLPTLPESEITSQKNWSNVHWARKREDKRLSEVKKSDPYLALENFRILIHSDHSCARHLRAGSQPFRDMLRARHRLSSSVVPPLPALQQLYSFLDVAGLIDQLTADDWNSYIFWLSHHKDYSTMSRLHSDMFSHPAWSSKYSPLSYTLLIKARQSQSTLNHTGSDQSPSTIVQKTIDLMMTSNVPPNSDLYGLWLQRAVQERNWLMGIEAWTQMKAKEDQLSSPSIAMTTYAVQCYLHHHDMVKVEELFKLILEQSSSTQQRQNYAMVQDGGLLPEASADGERETSVMDGRLEFQRRLKQSMEDLTTLQQQNNTTKKSNKTNPAPSNLPSVQEWKGVINPALIEAICLSERSNYGAAAAAQLALELFNHGHVLDSTRFRYLIHYVGACNTSADAETLVKQLMSVSSKDEHNTRAKDSRKNKRIVGSTWLALIEVGLQEVVKQAILDWDFDRARKIFQGMAKERISLGIDASEKLIVGLIKINDCRMALAVLDKSLQENRVPTLDTLNQLFKGLIKYHMLDEAIAMFRDLTENNGLQPDLAMYRSLIRVSSSYGQLGMVQRVISRIRNIGVPLDEKIYKDMMLCYVRVDNLRGAVKVFEEMNRTGISSNIAHINVLLEGAVRSSSSTTVLGILEIMASLKIKPDPETWRIMLSGAFRAKDRVFASEIYQELIHAGTGDALARGEGEMHAPRHPRTFQLLLNEYSNRHGVDAGLRLLKSALDAGYPSGIASSMYLELIDKSCIQGKGVAGYGYYQLLRQSQRTNANMLGILTPDNVNSDNTELSRTRFSAMSSAPVHAVTSTSTTVAPIPLQNLFFKLLKRVEQEGQIQVGADMATDLIVSGFEMNPDLVESAIRFYSRSGELAAAFGLFMKMGHVYSVAPTRGMVQDLYAAARAQGLLSSTRESLGSAAPSKWDESLTQLWIKVLKEGMEKVEPAEDPTAL